MQTIWIRTALQIATVNQRFSYRGTFTKIDDSFKALKRTFTREGQRSGSSIFLGHRASPLFTLRFIRATGLLPLCRERRVGAKISLAFKRR